MIKRILVPVDGSDSSQRALDFAVDLASRYSSEMLIVSVMQEGGKIPPEVAYRVMEGTRAFHEDVLRKAEEKLKKVAPSIDFSTKLMEGYASDKIIEAATEAKCDLIVMGRRGRGHLTHTFLGSVSDRVADGSPCPLLIVK